MTDLETDVNLKKNMKIDSRKKAKNKKEEGLQPFMFAVGEEFTSIQQFIVYCNDVKYYFRDPIEAFICAYAMYFVFNLEYQSECYGAWHIIQKAFFNMENKSYNCNQKDEILKSVQAYVDIFLREKTN